ncbi:hypothetical protein GQ53DRAFT_265279 [Thozetella sp. PMI_491]|nr:hypothetical protein GQ53DRAFT_265279 [Thozetella sp. PMI_491]
MHACLGSAGNLGGVSPSLLVPSAYLLMLAAETGPLGARLHSRQLLPRKLPYSFHNDRQAWSRSTNICAQVFPGRDLDLQDETRVSQSTALRE